MKPFQPAERPVRWVLRAQLRQLLDGSIAGGRGRRWSDVGRDFRERENFDAGRGDERSLVAQRALDSFEQSFFEQRPVDQDEVSIGNLRQIGWRGRVGVRIGVGRDEGRNDGGIPWTTCGFSACAWAVNASERVSRRTSKSDFFKAYASSLNDTTYQL
jgi:hypothetical protein